MTCLSPPVTFLAPTAAPGENRYPGSQGASHMNLPTIPPVVRLPYAPNAGRRNAQKQATGFVVKHDGRAYLVSNGHVFSGRHPFTGASDHTPDTVSFSYWRTERDTSLLVPDQRAPLHAQHEPLWLEHPTYGRRVDVAALPLDGFENVPLATYDPWLPRRAELGVGDDVTVVRFPFGVNIAAFAISTEHQSRANSTSTTTASRHT